MCSVIVWLCNRQRGAISILREGRILARVHERSQPWSCSQLRRRKNAASSGACGEESKTGNMTAMTHMRISDSRRRAEGSVVDAAPWPTGRAASEVVPNSTSTARSCARCMNCIGDSLNFRFLKFTRGCRSMRTSGLVTQSEDAGSTAV